MNKNQLQLISEIKKNLSHINKIDKSKGSIYNSWRSKVHTKKGKTIGFPEKWKTFVGFLEDMSDGWDRGLVLVRINNKLLYSKENCIWLEKGDESNGRLSILEYKGCRKTLVEWCDQYNLNYNGVRQRYFKGNNYTPYQILFGKNKEQKLIKDISEHKEEQQKKNKISKMLSAYRCKDKKRGFVCNISLHYMRLIVENSVCIYCGDNRNIGLDRIDNKRGHEIGNVVPCCYHCNIARGDNFSFEEMIEIGKTIKKIKKQRYEIKTGKDL